ncbi:phage integrase SAM-like domain-containing protein [Kaistella sp.]|uniref:phage integrase SAM-like domain-containing protein n=1 Tax=Kaistella sp. TaxID=2782235 RepID=UPI0035A07FA5
MLTISFSVASKNTNAKIYISISGGRGIRFRTSINETISNPNNLVKGAVRNTKKLSISKDEKETLDKLSVQLEKIKTFVSEDLKRFELTELTLESLKGSIKAFYNGGRHVVELDCLENYLNYYQKNLLPFRTYKNNPISERTKRKQITVIEKMKSFIKTLNKNIRVSDYGVIMGNEFVSYLRDVERLNDNTVGKYLKYSKTIVKDAVTIDIATHPTLDKIKGFTVETPTVILTTEELEKIIELNFINERWEITRDWFIVAVNVGQRGSDLFRMNNSMIITDSKGREYVDLTQQKVKVYAKIPLNNQVQKILKKYDGKFPPLYSSNLESNKTFFSKYLKEIAKRAGLNRLDFGLVYDDIEKMYVSGMYPIHKLLSSHIGRRQFASMHYGKIHTPVIMAVTGHKTEAEFLKYIGKGESELSDQMFDYWDIIEADKIKKLEMKKEA